MRLQSPLKKLLLLLPYTFLCHIQLNHAAYSEENFKYNKYHRNENSIGNDRIHVHPFPESPEDLKLARLDPDLYQRVKNPEKRVFRFTLDDAVVNDNSDYVVNEISDRPSLSLGYDTPKEIVKEKKWQKKKEEKKVYRMVPSLNVNGQKVPFVTVKSEQGFTSPGKVQINKTENQKLLTASKTLNFSGLIGICLTGLIKAC